MPLPELVVELFAPIARFFVWLFVEVLWELPVKGAGYLVVRPFKRDVTMDSGIVFVVGFALSDSRRGVGLPPVRLVCIVIPPQRAPQ